MTRDPRTQTGDGDTFGTGGARASLAPLPTRVVPDRTSRAAWANPVTGPLAAVWWERGATRMTGVRYTRGNAGDYKRYIRSQPDHIAARAAMANTYRQMRRDNPAGARLLRRIMKTIEHQALFGNGTSDGSDGLGGLLR